VVALLQTDWQVFTKISDRMSPPIFPLRVPTVFTIQT